MLEFINSEKIEEFNYLISSNYIYFVISSICFIISLTLIKNLFKD